MKKHRKPYIVFINFNDEKSTVKDVFYFFKGIIQKKKKEQGLQKILNLPHCLNNTL